MSHEMAVCKLWLKCDIFLSAVGGPGRFVHLAHQQTFGEHQSLTKVLFQALGYRGENGTDRNSCLQGMTSLAGKRRQ